MPGSPRQKRSAEAIAQLTAAADAEDKTDKAAVTPGPFLPARESLGELLLLMGRPGEALAAFEAALARERIGFMRWQVPVVQQSQQGMA